MAENINALILPIGADPSQFKESLNDVKAAFKELGNTIASLPFNLVTDKQKEQFVGLLRTISTLTTDVKDFGKALQFPENSIAGITQKINDLNKLKISLDATTSSQEIAALTQQIEKLVAQKNAINSLGKTLVEAFEAPANSIAGLDKRIAELNKRKISLDATKSASEIARLTKEIDNLTSKRNNLDNLGKSVSQVGNTTQGGFKKIEDSSKRARIAVSNLSLVAQDLPFGFIAIQNNLPNLFASLGQLDTKTNGLKGAFKDLGSQLIGPAGAFLAFSIVTAAVTFAVKEYGSLTNAVKVLFGANSAAIKSQNDFNKALLEASGSTGGQIAKINILVATIQNENSSQQERLAAYRELKKVNPDVVAGIDEQNLSTAKSIQLIGENAKAQIEFIKLQIKAAGITKALDKLEEQKFEANGKYNAERKKELDLINFIAKAKSKDKKDLTTLEINTLASQNIQLKAQAKNVKEASDAIAQITKEQEGWTKSLEPTIGKISAISSATKDLTDDLDKLRKSQEEVNKNALKGDPIGTITEGVEINNGVITSDIGALIKVIQANVRLTNASVDQMVRYRDSKLKQPSALDLVPNKISKIPAVPMSAELQSQIGSTKLMLEETAANFATAREALTDVFFNPLTDLFTNFTENGKNAFKEFGKAILATIKQLVARIIATGIINLLASILVPGGAQAASLLGAAGGGGSKIGQAFGSAIRSVLGIKSIANPSFAGVGGGGMQMNGQVIFVQRGSDLVGVLNRTNGTINRVG